MSGICELPADWSSYDADPELVITAYLDQITATIAARCGSVAWTSVMVDAGRRDRADLDRYIDSCRRAA